MLDDTDAAWWQVRYDGMTGYAMTGDNGDTYLTRISTEETPGKMEEDEATRGDGEKSKSAERSLKPSTSALAKFWGCN